VIEVKMACEVKQGPLEAPEHQESKALKVNKDNKESEDLMESQVLKALQDNLVHQG
jgi:hypothetical protein